MGFAFSITTAKPALFFFLTQHFPSFHLSFAISRVLGFCWTLQTVGFFPNPMCDSSASPSESRTLTHSTPAYIAGTGTGPPVSLQFLVLLRLLVLCFVLRLCIVPLLCWCGS
jgi:hypothetical protein